jgi:hypothetical protein
VSGTDITNPGNRNINSWHLFLADSGTIDYTAAEQNGGLFSTTVTASDSTGASGSATFNWNVTNTDTPPSLDNPGDQTNSEGDAVALQLSASDPDGDPITYSAAGLPNGLTFNSSTGLISGVIAATAGAASPYAVTVSASDGSNTASQSFTWTVTNVQIAPVADQNNLIGDSVTVGVNAWDNANKPIAYSAGGLPPGASIDATTGLISGTIAASAFVNMPYNVSVTASDGTDSASTSFAWNISTFTLNNPGDQSNSEGNNVAVQLGVSSNGTLPALTYGASGLPSGLAINPSSGLIAGTIANMDSFASPYSVTVSASDGTTTSSQSFTWNVSHIVITSPGDQINAPGDTVTLPIQANDADGDTLSYSAGGLPPGLNIDSATGVISGSIASTAGSATPYAVTVSASDGTNSASASFNWTVSTPSGTVSITNPGTQHNAELDNVSLPIVASDSAGNPLTFTATGLPVGLQIDSASGLISGTVDGSASQSNGGVYKVTVLASDGSSSASATFTWNISHTNQAPTLDNPGDQINQAGDVVSLSLNGSDADGDTVTYSASGLPSGLSLDSTTGVISGTLPASAASATPYNVSVTASDGSLSVTQTFNWFVTKGSLTLTNPGDQSNNEGDNVSLQLSATGGSGLSYGASGLPSGLSINSSTGLISGTLSTGDAANGPYTITISASDSAGDSAAQQFTWNVNTSNPNLNPVVTNPGAQINAQGDVLSLQIGATDPAGNGLTYGASGLPPGLSIDPTSGLISGVLSNTSATGSPYTVTVSAADGSNNGSATFTWTVTNGNVMVSNPGTQSSTAGASASLQISASDSAQLPLTYGAAGLPPGLSINTSTGLISGTIDPSAGGSYQVAVSASDSNGNSGSAAFTWKVTYLNQAPTLDNPGDQVNHAGDAVSVQLSGSDVDGDTVTYSATGLPPGLSVDGTTGIISGTLAVTAGSATPYNVTVTASDGSLSASQTFNWLVSKDVVTLTNPGVQTNTEGDTVSLQLSASDSGNASLTYAASGLPSGLSINSSTGLISGKVSAGDAANGPYTVTVSAGDAQGNSAAQQFTWIINAPAHSLSLTNPGPQSNSAGDNVTLQLQGSDMDGDPLTFTASGLPFGLTIDSVTGLISGTVQPSAAQMVGGHYSVTVTVDDGNGDSVSQTFSWTISNPVSGPWLDNPGSQENWVGDNVTLTLVGGSSDGKAVSYSATGLPAGLSVNPTTGLISGSITAAVGQYTVKAAAVEGSEEADQTFTWQVAAFVGKDKKVPLVLSTATPADIKIGGRNGAFAWPIQWQVTGNKGGGVILQRLQVQYAVKLLVGKTKNEDGKPDPSFIPFAVKHLITLDWYEAWIVDPKAKNPINPIGAPTTDLKDLTDAGVVLPEDPPPAKMNDWFFQTNPGRYEDRSREPRTTYGSMMITGTAIFYQGLTEAALLKLGFDVGSKLNIRTGAGDLLSYRMDLPGNVAAMEKALAKYTVVSEKVSRYLSATWEPHSKTAILLGSAKTYENP